jgi:CHRD domain-containing protein
MRGRLVFGVGTLAVILAVGSCKDDVGLTSIPPDPERYIAFLSGANERATPVTTGAQGLATVTVNGNVLSYRVELSNIDSAFAAHIHHAVADSNGPVRVNLFIPPRPAKGLDFSGLLVADTITVGDSVLTWIRGGAAYVNVHTLGVTGADGSGGHGGGEIRGQLFRFQ